MPYHWQTNPQKAPENSGAFLLGAGDPPRWQLTLWPHRSLPRAGFVAVIATACAFVSLPLLATLGTSVLWGLLPFVAAAVAGLWYFLERSYADGATREILQIWDDAAILTRRDPRRPERRWQANPHWVEVAMRAEGGPVENYLTLRGGGRTVEIGAFLSPGERAELLRDLQIAFARP